MFRRILCPIDVSESSPDALEMAGRLAQLHSAELVVLTAFTAIDTDVFSSGQMQPADRGLERKLQALQPSSVPVKLSHAMHAGPAGEVICWFAKNRECDLIVMQKHGRAGWKRLLLGGVADYVVHHAPCPVLLLPAAEIAESETAGKAGAIATSLTQ